jgi:hypothetical protein
LNRLSIVIAIRQKKPYVPLQLKIGRISINSVSKKNICTQIDLKNVIIIISPAHLPTAPPNKAYLYVFQRDIMMPLSALVLLVINFDLPNKIFSKDIISSTISSLTKLAPIQITCQ